MSKKTKTAVGWIVVLLLALAILHLSNSTRVPGNRENFSTFLGQVQSKEVAGVTIRGNQLTVEIREPHYVYTTIGAADEDLVRQLSEQGAYVLYEEESSSSLGSWGYILIPLLLILVLFLYIARQSKNTGGILSLGKSRARRIEENAVNFDAVGGLADAKEKFASIIDFLKRPKRWVAGGVRLPRGVLLVGPPGCGKTLMARAVAGEAGVPFFSLSASEFVEIFVGVGAARVRDLFDQARKEAPALIFIDELDAVGRRRGSGIGSSHDEREHTLNQLLAALDGFEPNEQIVVIAATNRPDVLDSALLRPGRFDQRIAVDAPGKEARLEMLRIHTRNKSLAGDVSLEAIAGRTSGFSGADLESLTNESALLAVQTTEGDSDSPTVTNEHFERALGSTRSTSEVFNQLDTILIESASQVSQPTGNVEVRLTLRDGTNTEGRLLWADGNFVKIGPNDAGEPLVIAKSEIRHVEALAGTAALAAGEVVGDRWSHRLVDTM